MDFDFEGAKVTAHLAAEAPYPDSAASASELCLGAIGIGIDAMEGMKGMTRWMMTAVGCHLSKFDLNEVSVISSQSSKKKNKQKEKKERKGKKRKERITHQIQTHSASLA